MRAGDNKGTATEHSYTPRPSPPPLTPVSLVRRPRVKTGGRNKNLAAVNR